MRVKERLDYYHLPCSFPIEATGLLSKVLSMLDGKGISKGSNSGSYIGIEGEAGLDAVLKH